jgi:hypothetical protein
VTGWDCVSELRPPTGLLFIPRVICEHGEPWWWCRLGITPDSSSRALWQSNQRRHLGQVGEMNEGARILPISIWNTSKDLEHDVKSYGMGPPTLLPIRRKVRCWSPSPRISPLKIHRFRRVWTRDPWSSGRHSKSLRIAPYILNLGTRKRWVANFTS